MKLIALDVGEKRIGVAKADTGVKIAVPVGMIPVDGRELSAITRLCTIQNTDHIIVGMPRNLQGRLTKQSEYVKDFVNSLKITLESARPNGKDIKVFFQDESLTSVQAKQNLKLRNVSKQSGEIDAESAALILQDFLENLPRRLAELRASTQQRAAIQSAQPISVSAPSAPVSISTEQANDDKDTDLTVPTGDRVKNKLFVHLLIVFIGAIIVSSLGAVLWYNSSLSPVIAPDQCTSLLETNNANPCANAQFIVEDGSSVSNIADSLKNAGLIRSSLAFKIYAKLSGKNDSLKAGNYSFAPSMTVEKIYTMLVDGSNDASVFSFTALPGETLNNIKERLVAEGYSMQEINDAFYKKYDHPVLVDKPADASLEGYLFGETYEFYKTDTVEDIIKRMLDELYAVVQENNLREKFLNLGYNLHEGIIMASIVQKEAGTLSPEDQRKVAQVFWSRLGFGWKLGSDVTATYAADQIDPDRTFLDNNAAILDLDSCYNTRKNTGLPCGPISNPGAQVLISTASPADTTYLYFLTGDDGLMYYSSTEAEHLQNRDQHCQNLCNTQL
ncbi:endolytic transglycosylase MltG [Candidatus Saccharibacteria bacterium]|nr:endolytic transglycosylase MltG [Candidatus Saccharibacteria bacterium]